MTLESDRKVVTTLRVILAEAYNDAERFRDCVPGVYKEMAPHSYRTWSETFWNTASQLETEVDYQRDGKSEESMREFIKAASIAINQQEQQP